MLSIEESKKHLKGLNLTDEQIEKLRGELYELVNLALDSYYEKRLDNNPQKN